MIDPQLQTIIINLGLTQNQFPFFILYYEMMSDGPANNIGNCCILGTTAPPVRRARPTASENTTSALFSGSMTLTRCPMEFEEWIFGPAGVNAIPPWGNVGQVAGCQDNARTTLKLATRYPGKCRVLPGPTASITTPRSWRFTGGSSPRPRVASTEYSPAMEPSWGMPRRARPAGRIKDRAF